MLVSVAALAAPAPMDLFVEQALIEEIESHAPGAGKQIRKRLERIEKNTELGENQRQVFVHRVFQRAKETIEIKIKAAKETGTDEQVDRLSDAAQYIELYRLNYTGEKVGVPMKIKDRVGDIWDRQQAERKKEEEEKKKAEPSTRKADRQQSRVVNPTFPHQRKIFSTGTSISVDFGVTAVNGDGRVEPTFGNREFGSNTTGEVSVGIDVRTTAIDFSPGVSFAIGAWGRLYPEGEQIIATFERHPTPGRDTFMLQDQLGFILLYTGIRISDLGRQVGDQDVCNLGFALCKAALTFFIGPRLQINKTTLQTDESGGGGARERFTKTTTDLGFTIGADLDMPLTSTGGFQPFVRFGFAADFTPERNVRGTSGLGFNYDGRVEGNVDARAFVGFGLHFTPMPKY